MADRIADNADLVVDDMKRKARRRLVGAIVLALAAAIILPMLLEKEPRPLGDDVSVQIPPVDDGKFVNRLTGKASDSKPLPKAESRVEPKSLPIKAAPASPATDDAQSAPKGVTPASSSALPAQASETAPKKSAVEGESNAAGIPAAPGPAPAKAASSSVGKAAAKPESDGGNPSSASAPQTTAAAPPIVSATSPTTALASTPAAASTTTVAGAAAAPGSAPAATRKADGFAVQLAAYADDKGANSLANKLKKVGYPAYVEAVETSRGTLWRVRVGGYESKGEAEAARVKLKGEGYSGIVAAAK